MKRVEFPLACKTSPPMPYSTIDSPVLFLVLHVTTISWISSADYTHNMIYMYTCKIVWFLLLSVTNLLHYTAYIYLNREKIHIGIIIKLTSVGKMYSFWLIMQYTKHSREEGRNYQCNTQKHLAYKKLCY